MIRLAAVLLALGAVGCQPVQERPAARGGAATSEMDLPGFRERMAEERGRVVVVNFWATWCEPCREEFPELIRLHRRYRDRGLTLLSISLDAPKLRETKVREFLEEQSPSFPVFLRTGGDDDDFINGVDPTGSGALPATFVYDRSGRRRQALIGQQTFRSLEGYIQPLL